MRETPETRQKLQALKTELEAFKTKAENTSTDHGLTEDSMMDLDDALGAAIVALDQAIDIGSGEDEEDNE